MKKLITAIAAIATSFGLFAADFAHSVTNDICIKTNNLVVGYDAMGATMLDGDGTAMTVNWFADSLKTDFHTNIANYEQPELKVSDTEPSYQYLAIDTDVKDPVLRTFSPVMKADGTDNYDSASVTISDHGVFIDTETTFTLFDTVPESPSDSKILVWARETEADEDAGIAGATNLMVTCGTIDTGTGMTVPTNYVLAVDGIVPETMYRLTIRADKEKNSENTIFRVYLNGEQLKTVALEDGTTLEVFPSLVDGTQELGAAGFGGTGSLKGIDLLTEIDALEKVPFAVTPTFVTITWDENVASLKIGDVELAAGDNLTTNYQITAFNQNYNVEVTYAPGYRHGAITGTGFKTLTGTDTDTVTFSIDPYTAASLTVTPERDRDEVVSLTVDGIKIDSKLCGTLLDPVLAYINSHYSGETYEESEIELILGDKSKLGGITLTGNRYLSGFSGTITIDLNGNAITNTYEVTGDEEDPPYIFEINCDATFKDSVGGGAIVADDEDMGCMVNSMTLTLDTANITYEGEISNTYIDIPGVMTWIGTLNVNDGRFTDKPTTGVPGHENEGIKLPEGKVWTDTKIDGYWQLRTPGEVVVVVPALTTGLTIESIVTNSVPVENPVPGTYAVKENQSVVVTYAPDTGYEFADDAELGVRTATESGTIEPPTVVAIPVTLTITKGEGVASVTYTVNDDTAGATVKIGDVIKITDVTYATGYEADGTYVKDYEYTVVAADVTAGSISWTVGAKKQTFTVTVPAAPEHTKVEVKTDDTEVDYAASYTLDYGTKVDVVYAVTDAGYQITANASTNIASLVANVDVVTPTVAEIAVTAITLDKSSVTIYVGGTSNVVATIVPAGALTQTVTWEYTALEGFATAVAEGNTLKITGTAAQPVSSSPMVIKAKVGAIEATCDVFVIAVPAVGPKSETPGADVEEEDLPGGKVAKVTLTDDSLTAVEISGLGAETTVQIPAQISEIKGLGNGNAVKVISRDGTADITAACKKTLKAATTDTYIVDLDETAKVTVDSEQIAVKPEVATKDAEGEDIAPMVIETSKVTINVKTIPGLLYKLVRKISLSATEWADASEWVTADAARKGLEATKTSDPASFYKIKVSK